MNEDSTQSLHPSLAERLLELLPDALVVVDMQQYIVYLNTRAEELFQIKAADILHHPLEALLPANLVQTHRDHISEFVNSQETIRHFRNNTPISVCGNGHSFTFLGSVAKVLMPQGQHLAVIIRELSGYLQTVEFGPGVERGLRALLEQTGDTVVITDKSGTIEYVNHAFEQLTGYTQEEVVGKKPNILKSDQHSQDFYENMWKTITRGKVYRDTVINRTKNGSLSYEYKTISPLYNQNGQLTHFLATGKDLTGQLQAESRLQYLTSHDPITGLINQDEFIRQLEQAITSLTNQDTPLAVVVFGLDNFKTVNQLLGRPQGDEALKLLGERLEKRTQTPVARLGGDEFCTLFRSKTPTQTGTLVDAYLIELAQPFTLDGEKVAVTATAGISCFPNDAQDGLSLVQKAETAMSRAKETGKYHFEFFTPDMQSASLEHLRLNKELLDALASSQFVLFYQPQIELATRRITGAEALIRWQPPGSAPILPQKFIPALEEMGRMIELGDFVLNEACTAFRRMRRNGVPLSRMAINLAAPQLEDPKLPHKITQALHSADLPPDCLELEVTESMLITHLEGVEDRLTELQDLGIGVALDDFGTGYSSLQYLTRYPFSKLKIDKSFVWNMGASRKDYEVVKAVVSLGHSLGINVLAEGVEDESHLQTLRQLGCEYVQGFLYSQPLDEDAFTHYVLSGQGVVSK